MRTICFIGNCQARTLENFYRRTVGSSTGDVTRWFDFAHAVPADGLAFIERADAVCVQTVGWATSFDITQVSMRGRITTFPHVAGGFLWPFGGGHGGLVNEVEAGEIAGEQPDPASHGMVQLRHLLKTDRPAQTIIDDYVNLDFGATLDLDRYRELSMDKQSERDEATGFQIARLIDETVEREPLFYTLGHYTLPVLRYMVKEVFARLGVRADDIERLIGLARRSDLLGGYSHPIHPSVARHFRLAYIDERTTYLFRSGERFNFRDYVSRIVNRNFNTKLMRGFIETHRAAKSPDALQAVIDLLKEGLAESVGSASGEANLAKMLTQQGRHEEALDASRRAFALVPDDPDRAIHLVSRLMELGEHAEADAVMAQALALSPDDVPLLRLQMFNLQRQRRPEESLEFGYHAIKIDPGDEQVARMLVHALNTLQRQTEAETIARAALVWLPKEASLHQGLGQSLWGQRRYHEAVEAQAQAAALEPASDWHRDRLEYYRARVPATAPQPA